MDARNPAVSSRIAWKTNDGGDIKAQDIVALAWIPLGLMTSVKDQNGMDHGTGSPAKHL